MRILDSFLWLRSYPPVPWHVWGFLHFLHYLHCFLIALDGCFSVKTPFVKVRFARFARIAVFFDGAYRAVWVQIDAMDDIIAHLFCFSKSDLLGGWLLKRPSSVSHPFHGGIQLFIPSASQQGSLTKGSLKIRSSSVFCPLREGDGLGMPSPYLVALWWPPL